MISRITAFIFLFSSLVFSQNDNFEIQLNEYHHDAITESVYSPRNNLLFTTDFSGKILMRSAQETGKSILFKESDGFYISDLNLIKNDSVLIYKSRDTLYGLRIHDKTELFKNKFNVRTFKTNQLLLLSYFVDAENVYMVQVMDYDFKSVYNFTFNKYFENVAVASDLSEVAFVLNKNLQDQIIEVYNPKTYNLLYSFEVPENLRLDALYFNEFNNTFEVLVYDDTNLKLKLYQLNSLINNGQALAEIEIEKSIIPKIKIEKFSNHYVLAHYSNSQFSNLVLIKRNGNELFFKTHKTSVSHVAITSNNVLVFENSFQSNKQLMHDLYDLDNFEKVTKNNILPSRYQYQAQFLSDDSWLVYQPNTMGTHSEFLKYFNQGTFNNRFFKLNFREYIETNHQFYVSKMVYLEDLTGKGLLYGYSTNNSSNYTFAEYDFIKDNLEYLPNTPEGFAHIVDYNSQEELVLFAKNVYYDTGYYDPTTFMFLDNEKLEPLKGVYKFGKLSKNGQYLMLISDKNQLTVLDIKNKLKLIHQEQLPDASYQILSLTGASFAVNLTNVINSSNCNNRLKFFNFEDGELEVNEQECITINSIAVVNNSVAYILNNNFLMMGDQIVLKSFSKKLQHVSFNKTADKIMITFSDDSVEIYDTESIDKIGVMLHPDNKTHVFIKDDKYFFGNVNYQDYLFATRNHSFLNWDLVDKTYENPLEVLSMFGTPNVPYAEALKKAIDFKQNTNNIVVNNNQLSATESDTSQNLYVLSIGVSDYKQSDYSLTYADKDALDMVKIFGTFSQEQNNAYLNKFYGKKFHLNKNDSLVKTVNAYYEKYESVGDVMPLNSDEYSWFSRNYEKFKFFDFNNNKTLEVELPYESSFHDIQYGITNDGSSFYTLNNQDLVTYNFDTGAISKEKLSENLNLYQYLNLNENEWIYTTTNASILELNYVNNQHINTRKKVEVDLMQIPYQIKDEYDSHPCNYGCMATLESATTDGNNVIIGINFPKEYYLISTQDSKHKFLKLPVVSDDSKQLIKIEFTINGEHMMVISEQESKHIYDIYDFDAELINSFQLNKAEFFHKQVNYVTNSFVHINVEEPLLNEDVIHFENHELFNNQNANSFNEVYTQFLTNDSASKQQIELSITDFLSNVKPEDQVVVFMAGHGVLDGKNNYYYAPYDMDFDDVKRHGISYDFIIDQLSSLPSQRKLLLMDTCHSGNVYDEVSGGNQAGQRGSKVRKASSKPTFKVSDVISTLYGNQLSENNLTVISASSGSDVAFEYKELGNGAFTHAFLKELKKQLQESAFGEPNWEKSVELNQNFIDEVFKEVVRITNNKQTPDIREISTSSNLKVW